MIKRRRIEVQGVAMEERELLAGVRVVCREHPHVQALGHVTKMIDEFVDLPETWKLSDAVKTRSFRLVARVAASFGSGSTRNDNEEEWQYDEGLQYAAIIGNLPLVQRLSEWTSTPLDRWGVISAALSGDLPLLQWVKSTTPELFHEHPGMWVEHVAFDVAAERGSSETVQWLVEAFPDTVWSLGPAALGGHLELVKWLHQNANLVDIQAPVTPDGLYRAFFDKFCDRFKECNNGEEVPEAVQWRFSYWWNSLDESAIPAPTNAMDWAARKGHLHVLEWLHANRHEGCSPDAAVNAAESCNMEVLLWLHERYNHQWTYAAMDEAARAGHLEIVKWLHANRNEGCSTHAMNWAAEEGHLDIVQWLHEHRTEGCTRYAMNYAAINGHLDVVQWLHQNRREGCTRRAMNVAAARGHLEVIQFLHANRTEGCVVATFGENSTRTDNQSGWQFREALQYASVMGDLPLLQRLIEWTSAPMDKYVVLAAALGANVPMLQWIKDTAPELFHGFPGMWAEHVAFDVAAEQGCFETVQWLVGAFPNTLWSLGAAVVGDQLELVRWLHQNANLVVERAPVAEEGMSSVFFDKSFERFEECHKGLTLPEAVQWRFSFRHNPARENGLPAPTDAMDWAARKGHLHMLEWLHVNRQDGCSGAAAVNAATAGNMDVLLWLHEHYSDRWTFEAMDYAARKGHLAVVEWMHVNRTEGCSTNAMDWAAQKGFLHIVQWLHEHRTEGCTTHAMNHAAKKGRLDIVQWLHRNRTEGCTTRAMDLAAAQGHLEVVQWLHANRNEGCTTSAVDLAAGYGHLEVIQWLLANRPERGTTRAYAYADAHRQYGVLSWLYRYAGDFPFVD